MSAQQLGFFFPPFLHFIFDYRIRLPHIFLTQKKKEIPVSISFVFPRRLPVFPGGSDWSACVLFKEAWMKAGLFTVPSKYSLSRNRKYHRHEAQQHTASANMQLLPPPPPPPPHGWAAAPAKQPSCLSENYAPLPSPGPPEWRTYTAGFSPPPPCPISLSPVFFCLMPPTPSNCLSLPVQHAWVAAWRWRS